MRSARRRAGGCWEGCARRATGGRGRGSGGASARARRNPRRGRRRELRRLRRGRVASGATSAARGRRCRRRRLGPRVFRLLSLKRASGSRSRLGPLQGLCYPGRFCCLRCQRSLRPAAAPGPDPAVSESVPWLGAGGRRSEWPHSGPFPLAPSAPHLHDPGPGRFSLAFWGGGWAGVVAGGGCTEVWGHPSGSRVRGRGVCSLGESLLEAWV